MKKTNIFWDDIEVRTPSENMAINKICSEFISENKYNLIARVYRNKNGVILGANESIDDIDEHYCRLNGYEIVRRPTGGSAIIVEPELTLCYSIFFNSKIFGFDGKIDVMKIYNRITYPLAKRLGENFSIEGNYYLRYKINGRKIPIAGHAMTVQNDVVQFDGVINLKRFNIQKIEKIIMLRQLYEKDGERFIKCQDRFFKLDGKLVEDNFENARLLRDEKKELENIIGLEDIGMGSEKFVNVFLASIEQAFNITLNSESPEIDKEKLRTYQKGILENNNKEVVMKSRLGHCYIDFIKEEQSFE